MNQCFYKSPVGILKITEQGEALTGISLTDVTEENLDVLQRSPVLQEAVKQLREYFQGSRKTFTLPLRIEGTPFQKKAWQTLLEIPYGHTISYGEEAERMQCTCARAVGGANGKNPLLIVVPCHRVIRADGGIGGYTGGIHIKEYLLALEKEHLA